MRAIQLKIDPFEFISILKWDCVKELGEHGVLRIRGLVAEDHRLSYHRLAMSETWVCGSAIDEDDEEIVLFQGVLTNVSIHSEHELHTMEIEVMTGSFLLDQARHIRTFQDSSLSYESLLKTCLEPENGWAIIRGQNNPLIGRFFAQYKETNWSFIKRLASGLGIPILPEFKTKGKRLFMGLNDQGKKAEIIANNYTVDTTHNSSQVGEVYQVTLREIHELGAFVSFENQILIVGKVESKLQGAELWHTYTLFNSVSASHLAFNYPKLSGVSLRASVVNVQRDRVQIKVHQDENNQNSGHRWFDYATVYSTPEGQGFYALPDEGDEVRLIFSENNELSAYVASSVHLSTEGGRHNPDHKSWKNKQGVEILMTPDELLLTLPDRSFIQLSEAEGIKINSDKAIQIGSDQQIRINSKDATISLSATDQVSIEQGSSRINMNDAIDISGGKINMN
ncbi:MAG: hypothetical protein FWG67_05435 [Defluviitaleaceae bacterium]|nr:hypothetical protein [Defluviitaleaceae bacterium]